MDQQVTTTSNDDKLQPSLSCYSGPGIQHFGDGDISDLFARTKELGVDLLPS